MDLFYIILRKIIPLYITIVIGYIAAKFFNVDKKDIGRVVIYIIAPVIVFYGTFTTPLSFTTLSLPVLFFVICCSMSLLFFIIGKWVYKEDSTKNILAFAAATGNTGYFGIPVAVAILGQDAFGLVVMLILGVILYEHTLGFYITARGSYSKKESIKKVITLPSVYAFFVGIAFNILNIKLDSNIVDVINSFKGAYVVFGMMLIGMGLVGTKIKNFDFKFISLTFFAKFLIYPLVIALVIWLDSSLFHIYNRYIYNVLIIMSVVPLAANTVALATELKVQPGKAAIAVLLSTCFALVYIPLIASIFVK